MSYVVHCKVIGIRWKSSEDRIRKLVHNIDQSKMGEELFYVFYYLACGCVFSCFLYNGLLFLGSWDAASREQYGELSWSSHCEGCIMSRAQLLYAHFLFGCFLSSPAHVPEWPTPLVTWSKNAALPVAVDPRPGRWCHKPSPSTHGLLKAFGWVVSRY